MKNSTICTLKTLPLDRAEGTLCLRLLNSRRVGSSANPDQFFAFGTLWTDEERVIVEGTSQRAHADILGPRLSIGSVYKISKFDLQMPRRSYRCSSFQRMLSLSLTTSFYLISKPSPDFFLEAFEFVRFANLLSRIYPCSYLTDIIGHLESVSKPDHVDSPSGITATQKVVLDDVDGLTLTVTLWADFAAILDPPALLKEDAHDPVVITFGGLIVQSFECMFASVFFTIVCSIVQLFSYVYPFFLNFSAAVVSAKSSTTTRISVNPAMPETSLLKQKSACCFLLLLFFLIFVVS
ncbi:hypothetical protein LINGRAHAP2_LOCUS32220 [Linum grandiflorum]